MNFVLKNASFITSAANITQCPPPSLSEVAFLGRSNVGKSTLINLLCNHKGLAKSSATPGKTQLINFFLTEWKLQNVSHCEFLNHSKKSHSTDAKSSLAYFLEDSAQKFCADRHFENKNAFLDSSDLQNTPSLRGSEATEAIHNVDLQVWANRNDEAESQNLENFNLPSEGPTALAVGVGSKASAYKDEFCSSAKLILVDLPGFGYAKVAKSQKELWNRNLVEFLKKRDCIRLFVHLVDCRHPNLEIDKNLVAFLEQFLRGDQKILRVFTKFDKLNKTEQRKLKNAYPNVLFSSSLNKQNTQEIINCIVNQTLGVEI